MHYEVNIMATPYKPPPGASRTLRKLGADIREARLRRNLPMTVVAERAATSRATLTRLEKGDPAVSIGIVAGVLQALGLLERLADVADASHDTLGLQVDRETRRKRASAPRPPGDRRGR